MEKARRFGHGGSGDVGEGIWRCRGRLWKRHGGSGTAALAMSGRVYGDVAGGCGKGTAVRARRLWRCRGGYMAMSRAAVEKARRFGHGGSGDVGEGIWRCRGR